MKPYADLRTFRDEGSGLGRPIAARLRGVRGYLYEGKAAGDGVVVWFGAEDSCDVALELATFGRLSQPEVERELQLIAESFRR